MTNNERAEFIKAFLDKYCTSVLESKGREYSREEVDVNSNFKRVGEAIGAEPTKVAWVYTLKHIDSISTFIKTRKEGTEPIAGRIGDAINYLFIIASLLEEENEKRS